MSLDLADYRARAHEAVKLFWRRRNASLRKQSASGRPDTGARGAVTGGRNMDGFLALARALVEANGLQEADVFVQGRVLTLPGFFRPTKRWDMLVLHEGQLVAALEFKSQVGSFGNNFNNRAEEAVGAAHDLWTAYRDGAFGQDARRPFLGWIMLLEDSDASRSPVTTLEPHFPVFGEFGEASYAERYDILCRKLVMEGLYTSSAFLLSPKTAIRTGQHRHLSELTSLTNFATAFAGHIAAIAAH